MKLKMETALERIDKCYVSNGKQLSLSDLVMKKMPKIVENCVHVEQLFLLRCELEELDLTCFPNLTKINCSNNNIKKLDLSQHSKLKTVICSHNQLTELIVHPNIVYIDCNGNQLKTITTPPCVFKNLAHLLCYDNHNFEIPTNIPNLIRLNFDRCNIAKIPNGLKQLQYITCTVNPINELPNDMVNLKEINCTWTNIKRF